MCGIFGIMLLNYDNVFELIINGLTQLQNRGYDSAGICVYKNNKFNVFKYASTSEISAIDKLSNINLNETSIGFKKEDLYVGIGHNRWATHGVKSDVNAHPHLSNNNEFVVVHNGIIENYNQLKNMLINEGFTFFSQTDTEVIVNLIEYNYKLTQDVYESIQKTINELMGTYGLIIQSTKEPQKLFCVRNGSPLLIGQSEDRIIVTSEQNGFCNLVNNYITLKNEDICVIERTSDNISVTTKHVYLKNNVNLINYELTPEPYKHWTLKEIFQQPDVALNSINKGGRIKNHSEVKLGGLEQHYDLLKNINNIIILGCGTSYFAGLYGMNYFKKMCNFNTVQTFDGAEINNYDIPKIGNTAFILISQSGETKDLHRCIELAKNNNIITIGIINVIDSLIAREVDCGIYCNAGKEVGVASTKAFTSQVICLSMAAIWFAKLHNINEKKRVEMISDLRNLSNDIKMTLEWCHDNINSISNKITASNMFLLGKGNDECIAREGSLKIKEISYIHSEGYSSSSLKHGPFALLDENFPVIILNLDQTQNAKTLNCYQEVTARNSPIVFITNNLNSKFENNNDIIFVPENKSYASLLGIIPIQLLAYYMSVNKGINPDKPKNLAKVVTVE